MRVALLAVATLSLAAQAPAPPIFDEAFFAGDRRADGTERVGGWADHRRGLRSAVSHGAGAWRATFRAP